MHEPRFVVSSVTGATITAEAASIGRAPLTTAYYVLDRWYCHRVVAAFEVPADRIGVLGVRGSNERRKRLAEQEAAKLNAWDAAL